MARAIALPLQILLAIASRTRLEGQLIKGLQAFLPFEVKTAMMAEVVGIRGSDYVRNNHVICYKNWYVGSTPKYQSTSRRVQIRRAKE